MIDNRPGWQTDALCRTDTAAHIDTFFQPRGNTTRAAKRICARCPVIAECREYAIVGNERFGVWGGMSSDELVAERQRRKAAGLIPPPPIKHGTLTGYNRCVKRPEGACRVCQDVHARYRHPDGKSQGHRDTPVVVPRRLADLDLSDLDFGEAS
jgi:Transcription factor WhiB